MSIKLALLKSGETIISDVKELISDEKACAYIFENPHKVIKEKTIFLTEEVDSESKIEITLTPWILLTEETQIIVSLDWVVTLVDPIKSVKELYEGKVNGENDQVSFTES